MYRLLTVGLALGLFLPSLGTSQEKKTDEPELKIAGKLTEDDPKDKLTKKPSQVHEFKMKAKSIYVIDLKSKDFDAFLRLEDSAGKQLAVNDDVSLNDLDSRIVFKAKKDGVYKIIATSYDGKPGEYTLTARLGTAEELAKADPFHELIGKPAPEIIGEFAINGKTKKLSDLKGKVVLIDFWAVWCGPCIQTFPHLREWDSHYKKEGLEILGVTTYYERFGFDKEKGKLTQVGKGKAKDDDEEKKDGEKEKVKTTLTPAEEHAMLKDFTAYHKLSHRILVESKEDHKSTGKSYLVRGIPEAVLIDRKGIVRMVRVGSGPINAAELEEEIKILLAEK